MMPFFDFPSFKFVQYSTQTEFPGEYIVSRDQKWMGPKIER